ADFLRDESDIILTRENNNPKLALHSLVELFYGKLSVNSEGYKVPSAKSSVSKLLQNRSISTLKPLTPALKPALIAFMAAPIMATGELLVILSAIFSQNGRGRAEYGQSLLQNLSKVLTTEFGKGFSVT